MRLGLTLGAALAFAVLCAICWHRGSVINRQNQLIGALQTANTKFRLEAIRQNTAIEELKRAGEDRATKAAFAVKDAQATRASHDTRAMEILSTTTKDDQCVAAENLIDQYRKAGAL